MGDLVDKVKPTGWLGRLYDEVATYNANPISEIERIAKQALNDNSIDGRLYLVLQYRIPLPGFKHETLEQVGVRLGVTTRERPRSLEYELYNRLQGYLPEETKEPIVKPPIEEPVTKPNPQMLKIWQVAAMLNAHPNTVRRWSNKGILPVYKIGTRGDRRYKEEDVKRFLNRLRHPDT